MRSITHDRFGDPATVLQLTDTPVPKPRTKQVRVRTILSPIHNHDLWTVRGSYGYKPSLPAVGGTEAVGVIDAVSNDGDAALVGRRMAVAGVQGSWAEYFLAPAAALVPIPDAIPDEAAAQLIAMPFSAISLLDSMGVNPGDWVIQNAANGAVGKAFALLARARGVHCINIVRRDAGVTELRALGIGHAVSSATPAWKDKVREIAGRAPLRAAVDSIGGEASGDLADLLAENGLLVSFGSMTGSPMQIPSGSMIFKQLTMKGFWGSKVIEAMPAEQRVRLIGELVGLVANGTLRLPGEAIFDLADISKAVTASLAPGKSGKVLLRP